MSVTSVDKDFDRLTLTLIADLDAPVEQVWQLWADPAEARALVGAADPPGDVRAARPAPGRRGHLLHDRAGRADEHGRPDEDMPVSAVTMRLVERDGGTRMELRSSFDSREQMDQLMQMGAAEGLQQSVAQMHDLL